jgi:ubiquinone/menaquinone biosynthesis C-methylase UbiE
MSRITIYNKLAEIYDQVMDHVNYRGWSTYINSLIYLTNVRPKIIADLSCGSGSFLKYYLGKDMFGIAGDCSMEMIRQAQNKTYQSSTEFFVGDMKNVPLRNACCDAVFILYDSINYLTSRAQLELFFNEMLRILQRNGILIFDVVTEQYCLDYEGSVQEALYWDNQGYEKMSHYDKNSCTQYTNFKIFIDDEYFFENHKQKIYNVTELKHLAKVCGFNCRLFDGFSKRPAHSRSQRVHFLCTPQSQKS